MKAKECEWYKKDPITGKYHLDPEWKAAALRYLDRQIAKKEEEWEKETNSREAGYNRECLKEELATAKTAKERKEIREYYKGSLGRGRLPEDKTQY